MWQNKKNYYGNKRRRRNRPWWWRRQYGFFWLKRNKPRWKWKKSKNWRAYSYLQKKMFTHQEEKFFKIKNFFKYNLKLRAAIKKTFGQMSHHYLKKQLLKKKNIRPESFIFELRNAVTKLRFIRNEKQARLFIKKGWIMVNGRVKKNIFLKIKPGDIVSFNFKHWHDFYILKLYFRRKRHYISKTPSKHINRTLDLYSPLKIKKSPVFGPINYFYLLNR